MSTDAPGVVRLGRFVPAAGTWEWFGYQLETTTAADDWIGLSEITVVGTRLAVIERDKLNGPDAAVKRLYTVEIPAAETGLADGAAAAGLPVLPKTLALDVLPALQATRGWVQEKLEGMAVGGDGTVYAVTDNDAVDDASGETQFMRLGAAVEVFPAAAEPPVTTEPTVPTVPATETPTGPTTGVSSPTTPTSTSAATSSVAPTKSAAAASTRPGGKTASTDLASTGVAAAELVVPGVVLVLLGAGFVVLTTRRRRRQH